MEETHCYFSLDVNHLNLEKYARMIAESELRDDLDCVLAKYNPQRGHTPIPLPGEENLQLLSLDAQLNVCYSEDPEYRKNILNSNISIPTSVLKDPALIALITRRHRNTEPQVPFEKIESIRRKETTEREELVDSDSD